MSKTLKDILIITASTLGLTLLVWLPYLLRLPNFFSLDFSAGFNTIFRNYDGIEYIIIAKTFYDPIQIASLPQSLPAGYYAAHFPGYALLILAFSPVLGFLKSMIFTSVLFTILSSVTFYFLVRDFKLTFQPLYLSLLFLVLPARWVIVHSVGSSEPVFIFFTLLTVYFFMKFEQTKKYSEIIMSSIFGSLALFTRPPGVLLLIALAIYIWWKFFQDKEKYKSFLNKVIHYKLSYLPLVLIPLTLLGIFYWYFVSYHDFFAYFHSGDNIHLTLPPYQIFNKAQHWVGDIWLEDIIYLFILGFLVAIMLIKRNLKVMGIYVLTFMVASILIAHRDISRYILPIFPFVLIAYEKILTSKEFKIVLAIILLGIYLYSQNFILNNTAPFPNLEAFDWSYSLILCPIFGIIYAYELTNQRIL